MKKVAIFSFILITALLAATGLQAQTDFTHISDQPVMDFGAAGEWDEESVSFPAVLLEGDTLRMWYTGDREGRGQIGYAWSIDGVNWNRYAGNPVLTGTLDWENGEVRGCYVRKEGDTFRMWYGADVFGPKRIGYATSADGLNWTKHPDPILEFGPFGDWDASRIGIGPVIREANRQYKMWYVGISRVGFGQTGLATSSDGINWVKYDDPNTTDAPLTSSDPVLKTGFNKTGWDGVLAHATQVAQTVSGYEMWYIGKGPMNSWVGYATSLDGISWRRWPENPIINTAPPWADLYSGGTVLKFDGLYHFWFTGGTSDFKERIGYATSPIAVSVETREDDSGFPSEYLLLQNYPNPFNPATTIQYALSHPAKVTLKVYNLMGQEVLALVENEQLEAGYHSAIWNGRNAAGNALASGVYLIRMQAGSFVQTRKMLLVQ